jgi:hypothetical protein
MRFEQRTSPWGSRSRGLASDRRGRSSVRLLIFLCLVAACDGDNADAVGAAGSDAGPGGDDPRDASEDRTGGAAGMPGEAGHPDIGGGTDVSTEQRADISHHDVDDGDPDVTDVAEPPDRRRADDANGDALDEPRDAGRDASLDANGASDAPRDTGPIVVGPGFARSVRFAVIGDYGMASTDEARVANLVQSWNPDFVITTGDNDYTGLSDGIDGVIGRYYSEFIGNYWGVYGPGSRTTRFWPSPGNHDWDVGDLATYIDYFTLPGNERYYEIDLGLVHLFALDSDPREPDGTTADSVQARWLQTQLARSASCFKIVYFHHAAYSSSSHGSSFEMRWPFEQWGADAVFFGHDHVYERFQIGQIPYFTVGLGGAAPYPFLTSLPETRSQYNADFGAMRVSAGRRGIRFEFVDANGTVVESIASRKRCP